jgi:hypothetical protein
MTAVCAVSPQELPLRRPERLKANAPWKGAFSQKVRKERSKYNCIGEQSGAGSDSAGEGLATWDISTSQDWSAPSGTHAAWVPDSVNVAVSGDPKRNVCRTRSGRPWVKRAKRSGDEARERPLCSAPQRAGQESRGFLNISF